MTDVVSNRVVENLKLVDYVIQRNLHIRRTDKYYEDYQQEGRLALIEAANRYDDSRGINFSTFAVSYIEGYIRKFRRNFVLSKVHISRGLLDLLSKAAYLHESGLDSEEIQETLSITPSEYNEILKLINIASLNSELVNEEDNNNKQLIDIVGYEDKDLIYAFEEERLLGCIDKVTESFNDERHKEIWREYAYKAYSGESIKKKELADKYRISQNSVSRLINKGKDRLKKYIDRSNS